MIGYHVTGSDVTSNQVASSDVNDYQVTGSVVDAKSVSSSHGTSKGRTNKNFSGNGSSGIYNRVNRNIVTTNKDDKVTSHVPNDNIVTGSRLAIKSDLPDQKVSLSFADTRARSFYICSKVINEVTKIKIASSKLVGRKVTHSCESEQSTKKCLPVL